MKIIVTCFIVCITFCSQAQPIDFGKVKADPNFDCNKNAWLDSITFSVPAICNSKNQLEIRLSTYALPGGKSSLIILTYNDSTWDIRKYKVERAGTIGKKLDIITFVPSPDVSREIRNYEYEQVFDSLKQDNVFLLPDQSKLKCDQTSHAWMRYSVTFKVNNSFGDYSFVNPESYAATCLGIKEFNEYIVIYKTLNSFFN
ncbi:MAG TPA: hypothetical protein VK559_10670 [Ferruginibacter sp.]|nr:hypothetical protein [Ferruginibacter sp.]